MTSARILIAMATLAGTAGLLAGCGTATPAASSGSSPSAPASTTPSTPPAATATPTVSPTAGASSQPAASTAACATSALHVVVPSGSGNAAAGSAYYPIQFSNTSGSACTLFGYPGVSFVTAAGGSQIGAAATRNATFPAKVISLSPGQTVHATLQVVDAMNYPSSGCGLVTAHWLRIYPPNQTASVYVSFTAQTCSKPKTVLSVQTVQTGSSGN
jgi:Protein of unknown function (DUF4232)